VAPYALGPIMGYGYKWEAIYYHWGAQGGYVTVVLLVIGVYGVLALRTALSVFLAAWIVTTLGKSFGIEPFLSLWNLVPGVTAAAFARYVQPSWELALVMLAAFGLDSLSRIGPRRRLLMATSIFAALVLIASLAYASQFWPQIRAAGGL